MAQVCDEEVRQQLAEKHHAPLGTKEHMFKVDNPLFGKVRSAAKALLKSGSKLPSARREELEGIVRNHFKVEVIDTQLLEQAMEMDIRVENQKFIGLHGERVVKDLLEKDGILDFIRMWRKRFLDLMKPKHLPQLWSVDHNLHKFKST